MSPFYISVLLTSAVLSIQLTAITGQLLTAEYLNIKLPRRNGCPKPHYDGEDSIFLLGGCDSNSYRDILKFSISSETLDKVGRLPDFAWRGSVEPDTFGNIFYFGGDIINADVHKFDPISNITTTVASLPYSVQGSLSIKYNESSNTVFILGGWEQGYEILSFDMATVTMATVSHLHTVTNFPFSVTCGTSVRVGNKAYIFDNTNTFDNRKALELDLDTFHIEPVGPPTLPLFQLASSSVWDGSHVHVIGGYGASPGIGTNGLIRFDPVTKQSHFIPVRNFPVEGLGYYFYNAPASVFVPSRNRIYFFGGQSYNSTAGSFLNHNEVFYIDMTPIVGWTPASAGSTIINTQWFLPTSLGLLVLYWMSN